MTHSKAVLEFREWLKDLTANNANVFEIISIHGRKDELIKDFSFILSAEEKEKIEADFEQYYKNIDSGIEMADFPWLCIDKSAVRS